MSYGTVADAVVGEFFSQEGSHMLVGGVAVSDIAERFGTPLYVYDSAILRSRYQKIAKSMGSRVSILYALKANSNVSIAGTLRLAGAGGEVASAGEIEIALAAGYSGNELQFAGPGKTYQDLRRACEVGVYGVNAESAGEIERLSQMAHKLETPIGVAIRVQQNSLLQSSRMRMSGGDSKFGVPADEVPALAARIEADPRIIFRGLHLYAGTQCFDADAWIAMATQLFDVAASVEVTGEVQVPYLNFGGGFGVPMFEGDVAFDIDSAGIQLAQLIDADARADRNYFIELGRYLTAPSGIYVARVTDVKKSGGKQHVILDGGMHHHASAVGIGSLIKRSYPIVLPDRMDETAEFDQCLGGPLCLPLDEFASLKLPKIRIGDLVAVLLSGAYGLSYSPVLFLSHPLPSEVLVDQGEITVIRVRGKPEDALRGQVLTRV